jgi:hypothetical protein
VVVNVIQEPALPPGWEKKIDPATGRAYYFDHNTKTSQWTLPAPGMAVATPPQVRKEEPRKSGFTLVSSGSAQQVNTAENDIRSAQSSILAYLAKVDALSKVISDKINPKSVQKTLIGRLTAPKAGETRYIKLTKAEKNDVLERARPLLDNLNQFIFDFNRYGKTFPERKFSEVMLNIGQFNENLDKFAAVVIKSETVKECLAKLKSKFSSINVSFSQQISYQNTGSQVANLNHNQVIIDNATSNLTVAHADYGVVDQESKQGGPPPGGPPPGVVPAEYGYAPSGPPLYGKPPPF